MPKPTPKHALVYVMPKASKRRWRIILSALAAIAAGLLLMPAGHPAKAAPVRHSAPVRRTAPAVTVVKVSNSTGGICITGKPRMVKVVKVP